MNKRIAAAVAMAGSLLLGPAALAASAESVSAPGYDLESADGIADHGQGDEADDHDDEDSKDDHDHDGDGRPDHDPEDHDDDAEKPKDDDH
jgi:hypothetical protein